MSLWVYIYTFACCMLLHMQASFCVLLGFLCCRGSTEGPAPCKAPLFLFFVLPSLWLIQCSGYTSALLFQIMYLYWWVKLQLWNKKIVTALEISSVQWNVCWSWVFFSWGLILRNLGYMLGKCMLKAIDQFTTVTLPHYIFKSKPLIVRPLRSCSCFFFVLLPLSVHYTSALLTMLPDNVLINMSETATLKRRNFSFRNY